jgi:hypothetical protein
MFALTGVLAISSEWTNRQLLFARQPEQDLEFNEEEFDEAPPPAAPPMGEPKQPRKRPFFWILLLLFAGGIGYVAMDPDGAMRFIEPYLDGGTEPTQPVTRAPTNGIEAPTSVPPERVESVSPPPSSAPTDFPVTAPPAAPAPKSFPPVASVADPLFSEGQRVTVIADPNRPQSSVPLFVDSAGTRTSATVRATAPLTILDGDYQKNGWIYAVRTEDGRKGWIPERSLRLKR